MAGFSPAIHDFGPIPVAHTTQMAGTGPAKKAEDFEGRRLSVFHPKGETPDA